MIGSVFFHNFLSMSLLLLINKLTFQSWFCTKHCFIIPSPPQFEEVCNIYSCSSVHILQMRKEVQRNLPRVTKARHCQGLVWAGSYLPCPYCFFSKRKIFSLGYCCCCCCCRCFSYLFGAKNMESAIFISKHLCTLLSPGRFKAQIGFYVERLAGGALFHIPNALAEVTSVQDWEKLQATSEVPWDCKTCRAMSRHWRQDQQFPCIWYLFASALTIIHLLNHKGKGCSTSK